MKTSCCVLILLSLSWLVVFPAQAQEEMSQSMRDILNGHGSAGKLSRNSAATSVYGVKPKNGTVVGDVYLDSTWREGGIKLYRKIGPIGREGDSVASVPLRLDLYFNDIEVLGNNYNDIRSVPLNDVKWFSVKNPQMATQTFVNTHEFLADDQPKGFVETMSSGKIGLYEHTKLFVKQPTYNPALNTGNKDAKIIKIKTLYVKKNGKLEKINPSKRNIIALMPDKKTEIEAFIKSKEIDFKDNRQVASVFNYYNGL